MATMSATAHPAASTYRIPFVIGASAIGTVIEWYDFYLYGVLAAFFSTQFFPKGNDTAALLASLATFAVALTLLAGTPALTFTGMIGAALAVTLHRGGLLLAVLVLPLSIPVLIFGVAASEAAISGPLSFGTPFSILCALSLISFVIGPFAAAASLRHGLD